MPRRPLAAIAALALTAILVPSSVAASTGQSAGSSPSAKQSAGPSTDPRVHRRKRPDLQRVEHAEDVQLSFLGEIGRVGKNGESDLHQGQHRLPRARRRV